MYEEMTLKKASLKYPVILGFLPREMFLDDEYIVRIDSSNGSVRFEVGYKEDEWDIH